ncbi:MAG: cytochrome P450, partial [Acidimicrobiia bacterium]|nr:cytochrome P450 [Acidimicrobiia bacterium]
MADRQPVDNWADDYDIFDPGFVNDPYPIWQDLRGTCPVAHSDRWGGSYMPSTFETVTQVAHDVDNFTSFEISVAPIPANYD